MLAAVMTIKPSCRGSKSKEQLTQAKQTSLINATKRNLKNKVHRLEEHKGHTCPPPTPLKLKKMMSSSWSLSLFSVSLPPSAGEKLTQTPAEPQEGGRCVQRLCAPPHCYDPSHSALVSNKEKRSNAGCRCYSSSRPLTCFSMRRAPSSIHT